MRRRCRYRRIVALAAVVALATAMLAAGTHTRAAAAAPTVAREPRSWEGEWPRAPKRDRPAHIVAGEEIVNARLAQVGHNNPYISSCSSGFLVQDAAPNPQGTRRVYVVTAGNCGRVGDVFTAGATGQRLGRAVRKSWLGSAWPSLWGSDLLLIAIEDPQPTAGSGAGSASDPGPGSPPRQERPASAGAWSQPAEGDGAVWDGAYNGAFRKQVASWDRSRGNELLCHTGAASFVVCGLQRLHSIPRDTCIPPPTYIPSRRICAGNLTLAQRLDELPAAMPPDSGGPVFALTDNGRRVIAKGIVSGGNGRYLWFTDISVIAREFGVVPLLGSP